MPTPHNSAQKNDFAETVLMPGDPLRSKLIAEKFLENVTLVNDVRGVQGYTGFYKGKRVSVMSSGMGTPSMGIYSYELFKFYNVKRIIRIGSIGAMKKDIPLKRLILAKRSYTNTNYDNFYIKNGENYIECSQKLIKSAEKTAKSMNLSYFVGDILCSDTFYTEEDQVAKAEKLNLLGVEMESAALYINAQKFKKEAITICTVSDNLVTHEELSSEDRQNTFLDMIKLALEMV